MTGSSNLSIIHVTHVTFKAILLCVDQPGLDFFSKNGLFCQVIANNDNPSQLIALPIPVL